MPLLSPKLCYVLYLGRTFLIIRTKAHKLAYQTASVLERAFLLLSASMEPIIRIAYHRLQSMIGVVNRGFKVLFIEILRPYHVLRRFI